jgi:hypothetical protein
MTHPWFRDPVLILVLPLANLDGLVHALFPAPLFRLDDQIELGIHIVVEEEFGKVVFLKRGFLLDRRNRRLRGGCRIRGHFGRSMRLRMQIHSLNWWDKVY